MKIIPVCNSDSIYKIYVFVHVRKTLRIYKRVYGISSNKNASLLNISSDLYLSRRCFSVVL